MVEHAVIVEMLDAFTVDADDPSLADTPRNRDILLREAIESRGTEAEETAKALYQQIGDLADHGQQYEIALLAEHPVTRPLLAILSPTAQRRADLYLRDAERWRSRRKETNARRLAEARRALDGFDIELARGLAHKIDGRFLTEDEQKHRDQLLLDISARTLEAESLDETGRRLIEKYESPSPSRNKPWWRRWIG